LSKCASLSQWLSDRMLTGHSPSYADSIFEIKTFTANAKADNQHRNFACMRSFENQAGKHWNTFREKSAPGLNRWLSSNNKKSPQLVLHCISSLAGTWKNQLRAIYCSCLFSFCHNLLFDAAQLKGQLTFAPYH